MRAGFGKRSPHFGLFRAAKHHPKWACSKYLKNNDIPRKYSYISGKLGEWAVSHHVAARQVIDGCGQRQVRCQKTRQH
jgi:hypothetical protein